MVDRMLERIKGMRILILDLMDLTKVESGKGKRDIKEINLVDIARMAIDTMTPYSIQKDIKLKLHGSEVVKVIADSEEMEIIFNNLISNAIKYNKQGGSVDCTLRENGEWVEILVEDTGIGMNPEDISRIFDDFVRIKTEKTRNITGSGLGLAIVKKLIDNYKGIIEVTSQPDQGSIFKVKLPIDKPCL